METNGLENLRESAWKPHETRLPAKWKKRGDALFLMQGNKNRSNFTKFAVLKRQICCEISALIQQKLRFKLSVHHKNKALACSFNNFG
jgi:hypothetical protein